MSTAVRCCSAMMLALWRQLARPLSGERRSCLLVAERAIKVVGCLLMLLGTHPLMSYADRPGLARRPIRASRKLRRH